jgi:vanillate O-demethylase monooxygenase subunit
MTAYAYNAWYPLAWSRDIGREIVARRVLEEDLAVYRTEEGAVAALEDACPHRLAPLSIGRLQGDAIQCGYHGLTFECSGRCVHAPGMPRVPESFRVRSYPTAESMGMVWVWMGDADKADRSQVFRLPQYDDPAYSVVEGDALLVQANYLSLADNLCDPTHVVYVHQTTLASAGREETRVQHERQGNKVVTWRWVIDGPLIPIFEGLKDFGGNVDRWHYYHYHAPSIAVIDFGSARTGTGAPEGNRDDCIQMYACHFITPIDQRSCIQHWLGLKNSPADPTIDERLRSNLRMAFQEDKRMLEAIQRNEDKPRQWHRINLGLDGSSIKMRRIVEEMAAGNG